MTRRLWILLGLLPWTLILLSVGMLARQFSAVVQPTTYYLPGDRSVAWTPGVTYNGGIPNRTSDCPASSGGPVAAGTSEATLQTDLNGCSAGQVLRLACGEFDVTGTTPLQITANNITIRGCGAPITGSGTLIKKTDGVTLGVDSAPNQEPVLLIGSGYFDDWDSTTSTNLSADGVKGSTTVTVASASGLAIGQYVLLDDDEWTSGSYVAAPTRQSSAQVSLYQTDRVVWKNSSPIDPQDDTCLPPSQVNGVTCVAGSATVCTLIPSAGPNCQTDGYGFFRNKRPLSEIKKIANVSGTTITFTSPLTITYYQSRTAQLTRWKNNTLSSNAMAVGIGVESLEFYGGSAGGVQMQGCAGCWLKQVNIWDYRGEGAKVVSAFQSEIRDSYIHDGAYSEPGGVAYAISLANASSELLIENNISVGHNKVIVSRGCGAGTVVGYNYFDDGFITTSTTFQEIGMNGSHLEGAHHMLFEGNEAFNYDADNTHGNAIDHTVLRNHLIGKRRNTAVLWASGTSCPTFCCCPNTDTGSLRTVGLNYGAWYHSFVGNVLGVSGAMSGWQYEDPGTGAGNQVWSGQAIFILGWQEGQWDQLPDPKVRSTAIREGNFDYVSNSVKWSAAVLTVPTSWYTGGVKPAFWPSACTWPWVQANGATKLYTLPARWRFDQGTPFSASSPC